MGNNEEQSIERISSDLTRAVAIFEEASDDYERIDREHTAARNRVSDARAKVEAIKATLLKKLEEIARR